MTVLIVAHSTYRGDIEEVIEALRSRGARVVRFDTDRFPTAARLSLPYGGQRGAALLSGSEEIDLKEISAVWLRGAREDRTLPEMAPEYRRVCAEAAEASVTGLLAELRAFQLEPRARTPGGKQAATARSFSTSSQSSFRSRCRKPSR